ncbi:MAG: glycosyltransferase [Bacteroidales bacterium]|nr:glycosyltransferase [Bacteroidales bacterium]
MRLFQLCYKPPYPPVDGGTLAMDSVTQGLLRAGVEVKVVSISSDKHPVRWEQLPEAYRQQTHFEAHNVDLSIHPLGAAAALLCGESYNVKRFYNRALEERLRQLLASEQFDIIQVESIFMAPYLPVLRQCSHARIVLRAHNVEHHIWRGLALSEPNPLRRWYLKKLALALRAYELEQVNLFDGVVCITPDDAALMRQEGCRKPITDIPFGIDLPDEADTEGDALQLYHLGAMDWQPNAEGVRWLLDEVWPQLHAALPQLQLHLAGRKMPDDLLTRQQEGVTVTGEVADAHAFMAGKGVNVVPLHVGSGLRVKIVEAMALGKAVVSTRVGAAGLACRDGEHLLLADTAAEMVRQVRRLAEEPGLRQRLGQNARRLVAERYTTEACTQRFLDFYNKIGE